jgi:hypothetical protein
MNRTLRIAFLGTLGTGLVAGLGYAAILMLTRAALRDAERSIEPRLAAYEGRRWTRPVLRGEGRDENAAALQLKAAAALEGSDAKVSEHLARHVSLGEPLPPALLTEADARAPALAAMRASTQATWSYTRADLRAWPEAKLPKYALALHGQRLLLARALGGEPGECLRTANDVIRMGQDLAPGAMLVGVEVAGTSIFQAAPVAIRCAMRADAAIRAAAIAELRALIATPPPTGRAVADDWLATDAGMYRVIANDEMGAFQRLRFARGLREMAQLDATLPDFTAADYPVALRLGGEIGKERERAKNPVMELTEHGTQLSVNRDAQEQARLRALVVAIVSLDDGPTGPKTRAALDDPALKDPFTGKALETEVPAAGGFVVFSRGSDGLRKGQTRESGIDDAEVVVPPAARP